MTKVTSPALTALLATRQFYTAKLFTFTLADGTVLRYCSGDADITYSGNVFSCGGLTGPYFERGTNKAKSHLRIGTSTDTLVFDVLPGSSTVKGFAFLTAIMYGIFDGATLLYQKAYMPAYGNVSAGVYDMFKGRVGDISFGRTAATFTINSHMELLNQMLPRNYYQPSCNNTLFDTACTLSAAALAVAGVIGAGSTGGTILANLPQATGYFDLGKLTFTSGVLIGFSIGVKSWTIGSGGNFGTFLMNRPFPVAPMAGDAFNAYPGCDKQQTTCAAKFNNFANFRGMPYVPIPETAG